mgnify:FL=1
MNKIETFTEFQFTRLCQFDELLKNINNMEGLMNLNKADILYTGSIDQEIPIDRGTIKTMKYGATALYCELKSEGLDREAGFIIFENKK